VELGRVCKLQPEEGCRYYPHCPIVDCSLLVPGGQAPKLLQPVDQPLHQVTLLVERPIKRSLPTLIDFARDGGPDPMLAGILSDGPAAVALVSYHPVRPQSGSALGSFHCTLGHQLGEHGSLMALPWSQHQSDQFTPTFGTQMYLGAEPSLATA
jgi:hypothetical protein